MRASAGIVFLGLLFFWLLAVDDARASTIAAGEAQSCSVLGGTVQCWGSNSGGALGDGGAGGKHSSFPVQVKGLTSGATAVALASKGGGSGSYGCAIVKGGLQCWGTNGSGTLGNGTKTSTTTPVQVTGLTSGVTDVSLNASHACAIQDGVGKCWGSGVLGTKSPKSSLVPVTVPGLSGLASISVGWGHACAIAGGKVSCWGGNHLGELGSSGGNGYSPQSVVGLPGPATQVGAGQGYTCALVNGGVWCWGTNGQVGKLGNGASLVKSSKSTVPVQVIGLTSGVTSIEVGWNHACAIRGGQALCWGWNANGQLGSGSIPAAKASNVPVPVVGLTGVTSMAAGRHHTCAMAAGKRWCFGRNQYGQLGNSVSSGSARPVKVTGAAASVSVKRSAKLGGNRTAVVATVACPKGGACRLAKPRAVKLKIGGTTYTAAIVGPASAKPGSRASVRVKLTSAAAAALKGRSAVVRFTLAVTANDAVTTVAVRSVIRG